MPRSRKNPTPEPPSQNALELLEENRRIKLALESNQQTLQEVRELIEQITAAPWHPALFNRTVETSQGARALVWSGGAARLVNLHPAVVGEALRLGDHVFLDSQHATIMAPCAGGFVRGTDAASFDRLTQDGRIVVRSRGDELVLESAAQLDVTALRAGDMVLFDRASRIALEAMDGIERRKFQLEDVGDLKRDAVGGQRETFDDLFGTLTANLVEPELARAYQLGGPRGILLYGPPGCGKTLMAKTAVAEIQRISGKRCRFAVVRPGEFESAYVGDSEANIRNCFRGLREEAGDGLGVLFLDEIESIGRNRGAQGSRHADRFLAALLAEMDGFAERGRISILAATNRRDLLDPALLSRLSDTQIAVPRPDRRAALEIFRIHLSESLPYATHRDAASVPPGADAAGEARAEVLETAVALLYAPNAHNEICRLQLRDGTSRLVHARELMSGRRIEQLAIRMRQSAFRRHLRGEGRGIRIDDVKISVESCLAELATTLSVHNARAYLDDLPQDVDVVRVDPICSKPQRRHRYYNAA